jgi:hypothetical protein
MLLRKYHYSLFNNPEGCGLMCCLANRVYLREILVQRVIGFQSDRESITACAKPNFKAGKVHRTIF